MEMWLDRQRSERAEATVQSYYYRVKQFVEWCEAEGVGDLNDLDGRDLYRYDAHLRSGDRSVSALNNMLGTLRRFLAFCADVEAVAETLPPKLDVPQLTKTDRTSDTKLTSERAEVIGEALDRFDYASRDHVLFGLAWHTCARVGGLHSLDVQDCFLDESDIVRLRHLDDIDEAVLDEVDLPFIYFRHRETTPLKNGLEGERPVALSEEMGDLIATYQRVKRARVQDEQGREALFSTEKGRGRMSKGAMRARLNIVTQPCRFGLDCPHGRDLDTCEAREHGYESRCPSSRSPHPIRTGGITHHLDVGWPIEDLSERVNATPQVIRDHYDKPDLLRRMQKRRDHVSRLSGDVA
ncbi:integrase [Halomarina oriensis]|uniref:Integrase n=2 Tax=Halomarina oriensis TaxID=671145 RepID=A0A6B0GW08_9EURY|nr:integrase [Halomarina oriensis]